MVGGGGGVGVKFLWVVFNLVCFDLVSFLYGRGLG